jgi:hypothetical protein
MWGGPSGGPPGPGAPCGDGRPRPAAGSFRVSILQGASRPTGASAADPGSAPLGTELLAYLAEKRYTVVVRYVAPGFSSVLGKLGWLGESG